MSDQAQAMQPVCGVEPVTGLILSGGGARAAYQVGVLAGLADLLPPGSPNPFPVIVGTSAGAINAVKLASGAQHFRIAVHQLTEFWQAFRSHQVLRSDWPGVIRQAARFFGRSLTGLGRDVPVALLNSSPLKDLLTERLDLSGIDKAIEGRHLRAVAVTAFGYESGQAVTFYQGKGAIEPWLRHRRIGRPTRLTVDHLLASSAIPMLFAPVRLQTEYFGDGAVRQSAPISPALHLGANRVLVVGVSGNPRGPHRQMERLTTGAQPSLAQIGGHMLNKHVHRQPGKRHRDAGADQPDRLTVAALSSQVATGHVAGGRIDHFAESTAGRDCRAAQARASVRAAHLPARAWGYQDQRRERAELSALRSRLLQRIDRTGAA